MRCNHSQFLFNIFAYIQFFDEFFNRVLRDSLIGTRQRFQRLVRMRIGLTAQDCLDGLGHDTPIFSASSTPIPFTSGTITASPWRVYISSPFSTPNSNPTTTTAIARMFAQKNRFCRKEKKSFIVIIDNALFGTKIQFSPHSTRSWQ